MREIYLLTNSTDEWHVTQCVRAQIRALVLLMGEYLFVRKIVYAVSTHTHTPHHPEITYHFYLFASLSFNTEPAITVWQLWVFCVLARLLFCDLFELLLVDSYWRWIDKWLWPPQPPLTPCNAQLMYIECNIHSNNIIAAGQATRDHNLHCLESKTIIVLCLVSFAAMSFGND